MLALFEVLSLEGWLEVRDVIIERIGPVSIQFNYYMYIFNCNFNHVLFLISTFQYLMADCDVAYMMSV